MTIREKICSAGVSTLREYMCLEAGGPGEIVDRLVPCNDLVLTIETGPMTVDIEQKILEIDIQTEDIDI